MRRGDQRVRVSAAAVVAMVVAAIAAQAAPAAGGFERGDVLASIETPSVIGRFAADGTAKGLLEGSSGAGPLCFDTSGEHLIAPGAGLYDNAGTRQASQWRSPEIDARGCAADASGNVYVSGGPTSGDPDARRGTIRKFDLTGHLLQTYDVDATGYAYGVAVTNLDLAPDQCTIYYDLDGGPEVKRYNACTGTQESPIAIGDWPCNQLRVRANGEVVVTCDWYGRLLDASGNTIRDFHSPPFWDQSERYAALDPDGSSFWVGSHHGLLTRFDIASGQELSSWSAGTSLHGVVVYSPPAPAEQQQTGPGVGLGETASSGGTVDAVDSTPASALATPTAPAFVVTRGKLVTLGKSLIIDTGLRATCPAAGARCRATVDLTVATKAGGAAAAARTTRVGTLRASIAPGAKAKLLVRLNKKGTSLLRKRHTVTIAARASVRAGGGAVVVTKTSIRARLRAKR